jgi:hypothetical protein
LEEAKAEQKGEAKADGDAAESGDEEAKRSVDYGAYSDLRKVGPKFRSDLICTLASC